ncbi:MAG: PAN domain-containing protein [Anaerolineales bacterium]|jgi:hypothetical protein|nr:PAN domain-containing protein [Anaerolineales bacterium]
MNKKLLLILILAAGSLVFLAITAQAGSTVNCIGEIKKLASGAWLTRTPNNQVLCFSYNLASSKYLTITIKSNQGKFNLFLAQGKNTRQLSSRLNRRTINSQGAQKTGVFRDLPAGDYVLAAQPLGGSDNNFSLKVDQVEISAAQPPSVSECSGTEACRSGFNVRNAAVFLGPEAMSTAMFPLLIKCPGQLIAEATWSQGPGEMLLEIYGPGKDAPYAGRRGPSPLRIMYDVTRADMNNGSEWSIDITNIDGGGNNLSLRYETPAAYCIPSGQEYLRKMTLEQNVDHGMGDYLRETTDNEFACQNLCWQDSRCAAFTFNRQNNDCWLKNTVTAASPCDVCVSGVVAVRVFPLVNNINLPEMDYDHRQTGNAELCRQSCIADLRCMAFTYNNQDRTCWLKWGVPQSNSSNGLVSGAASYRQASLEPNVNRWGGDYEHRALLSPSPDQCRLACAQDPRCQAYTFTAWDGICNLKDSVPPTSGCPGCTSGVVKARKFTYEFNTDRPQSDYRSFENPLNEPEICRLACAQDLRCTTYIYKRPEYANGTALCYLKDVAPAPIYDECCISGVLR